MKQIKESKIQTNFSILIKSYLFKGLIRLASVICKVLMVALDGHKKIYVAEIMTCEPKVRFWWRKDPKFKR